MWWKRKSRRAAPVGARRLEQRVGAGDVGVDEGGRAVDRAVDVALGGEVHHRVGLVRGEDRGRAPRGRGCRPARRRSGCSPATLVEVGEVRRVGQRVEVDDLVAVGDRLPHHRRADEAGAARHQKPHAFTPYSKGDVQSRKPGARAVLVREGQPLGRDAPVDADVGVVPAHAAVAAGVVDVVDLVEDQRVVGQRDEAVQEAARHQDLRAVLGRESPRRPSARRSASRGGRRPRRRGSRRAPPAPAWPGRRAAPGSAGRAACRPRPRGSRCPGRSRSRARLRPCARRSRSRRNSRARRRTGAASGPSPRAARWLGFPWPPLSRWPRARVQPRRDDSVAAAHRSGGKKRNDRGRTLVPSARIALGFR